jgi:1-phosphofructokinase
MPPSSLPVAVLAPAVFVSVTIEAGDDADDIHVHAGGQGIWIARMLRHLGTRPTVCAPVGGEAGRALLGLVREWGVDLQRVTTIADTPAYVHDRRNGERIELARSRQPALRRHEVDELYNRFLELALAAERCVVTGPITDELLPPDTYRRLGADLEAAGVEAIADLHGAPLSALLDGGRLAALKVSAEDLVEDGRLQDTDVDDVAVVVDAANRLVAAGAHRVLVSRGGAPLLAVLPEGAFTVTGPSLATVDAKGAGDSMTAAVAVALARELDPERLLAQAWAAGAANVTRRGLGSAAPGLIDELSALAEVERLDVEASTTG